MSTHIDAWIDSNNFWVLSVTWNFSKAYRVMLYHYIVLEHGLSNTHTHHFRSSSLAWLNLLSFFKSVFGSPVIIFSNFIFSLWYFARYWPFLRHPFSSIAIYIIILFNCSMLSGFWIISVSAPSLNFKTFSRFQFEAICEATVKPEKSRWAREGRSSICAMFVYQFFFFL